MKLLFKVLSYCALISSVSLMPAGKKPDVRFRSTASVAHFNPGSITRHIYRDGRQPIHSGPKNPRTTAQTPQPTVRSSKQVGTKTPLARSTPAPRLSPKTTSTTPSNGIKAYMVTNAQGKKVIITLIDDATLLKNSSAKTKDGTLIINPCKNVDAIVNITTPSLCDKPFMILDKTVRGLSGPELEKHCKKLPGIYMAYHYRDGMRGTYYYRCSIGQAVVTPSFGLTKQGIKYIIHTVAPTRDMSEPKIYLQSCYVNILKQACKHGVRTIAIPQISAGLHSFPEYLNTSTSNGIDRDDAARIAVQSVVRFVQKSKNSSLQEIRLMILGEGNFDRYTYYFEKELNPSWFTRNFKKITSYGIAAALIAAGGYALKKFLNR